VPPELVHVDLIGQPHWEAAGVADRIDLRIAPAAQTLEAMLEVTFMHARCRQLPSIHSLTWKVCKCRTAGSDIPRLLLVSLWCARVLQDGKEGTVDLAFIDADKPAYGQYYELLLRLLRPGGVIAVRPLALQMPASGVWTHSHTAGLKKQHTAP
jgi:O-methyltransferase